MSIFNSNQWFFLEVKCLKWHFHKKNLVTVVSQSLSLPSSDSSCHTPLLNRHMPVFKLPDTVTKACGLILDNVSYTEPFTKQTIKYLSHPEVFSVNK